MNIHKYQFIARKLTDRRSVYVSVNFRRTWYEMFVLLVLDGEQTSYY